MYKHRKSNEVFMTSHTGDELNAFLFDDRHFSDTLFLSILCATATRQSPIQLVTAVR